MGRRLLTAERRINVVVLVRDASYAGVDLMRMLDE